MGVRVGGEVLDCVGDVCWGGVRGVDLLEVFGEFEGEETWRMGVLVVGRYLERAWEWVS